jgi:hypothetical protein
MAKWNLPSPGIVEVEEVEEEEVESGGLIVDRDQTRVGKNNNKIHERYFERR